MNKWSNKTSDKEFQERLESIRYRYKTLGIGGSLLDLQVGKNLSMSQGCDLERSFTWGIMQRFLDLPGDHFVTLAIGTRSVSQMDIELFRFMLLNESNTTELEDYF